MEYGASRRRSVSVFHMSQTHVLSCYGCICLFIKGFPITNATQYVNVSIEGESQLSIEYVSVEENFASDISESPVSYQRYITCAHTSITFWYILEKREMGKTTMLCNSMNMLISSFHENIHRFIVVPKLKMRFPPQDAPLDKGGAAQLQKLAA